jgi:hypothetical protein
MIQALSLSQSVPPLQPIGFSHPVRKLFFHTKRIDRHAGKAIGSVNRIRENEKFTKNALRIFPIYDIIEWIVPA